MAAKYYVSASPDNGFALPSVVKVLDGNLPVRLSEAQLRSLFLSLFSSAGLIQTSVVNGVMQVSTSATANSTDAALRARSSHTGTQTSASISDFTEAAQDAAAALLASGTGVTLTYDDAGNKLTVEAVGSNTSGFDPEATRDAIGAAMLGVGNISVVVNDAGDTITISTSATANATDAALRDRAFHTGREAMSAMPSGMVVFVEKVGDTWGPRPTDRADIKTIWDGLDPSPPIVASGTGGMFNGDLRIVRGAISQ